MRHALTVDVEDWYHDSAAPGRIASSRVEMNTLRLLDVLERAGTRATFFVVGDVAEQFPGLVRQIADAGHEVGSHGYQHRPVGEMLRDEFRRDVQRSLRVIELAAGRPVRGYRAPCLSIKAGVRWPIDILQELGFRYDSSVLPIDRPPGLEVVCPRRPFRHPNGLWELPVAVFQFLRFWHLPLASGSGLRLLPPRLLRRWLHRFERDVGPAVFSLHPWEMDPDSPSAPGAGRWLLRVGRHRLQERLEGLLAEIEFGSVRDVFADCLRENPGAPVA